MSELFGTDFSSQNENERKPTASNKQLAALHRQPVNFPSVAVQPSGFSE
jgi:hypothetical protein